MSERNLKSIGLPAFNFADRKFPYKQAKRENLYLISALYPSRCRIRKVKKNQNNFVIACIGDII